MKRVLRFLSVLSLSALIVASLQPTRAYAMGPLKLFNFQLGAIGVYPSSGGPNSIFGQAAWTPTVDLGIIGVRGELGFTAPKNGLGDRFVAMNYEALLQLSLAPAIAIEGGGGFHNWMSGNGGTNGALSAGLVLNLVGIDHVYVTYTRLFLGSGVNEYKAGIGLGF